MAFHYCEKCGKPPCKKLPGCRYGLDDPVKAGAGRLLLAHERSNVEWMARLLALANKPLTVRGVIVQNGGIPIPE